MSVLHIDRTAEEYRDMARGQERAKEESFDRCDTDGFLSQWAHGVLARQYLLAADIAENGGVDDFPALFDLDGTIVPAKIVKTKFGSKWLVLDSWDGVYEYGKGNAVAWLPLLDYETVEEDGHHFNKPSKRSIAALAKKGYRYGWVTMKACVVGLDGKYDVTYVSRPVKGERYETAPIVEIL